MKSKWPVLCAVLSVVLCVAPSCNREEPAAPEPSELVTISFNASNSSNQVKTFLDGQTVKWTESDAITVFDRTHTNRTFSDITVSEGGRRAKFTGQAVSSSEYLALSPAQSAATVDDNGTMTASVPSSQTAVASSFGPGASLAVAKSEGDSLLFKNVCGLFAVKINNDDIKSVKISADGENGVFLTGKVKIDYNDGNPSASAEQGCDNVIIEGDMVKGGVYYAAVCPGTYSSFKITYTRADGKMAVYSEPSLKVTLPRSASLKIANDTVPESRWEDGLFADIVRLTNSTACISWTTNAVAKKYLKEAWPYSIVSEYDWSGDLGKGYRLQVYKDAACTEMQFERTVDSTVFNFQYPPRYTVSGLSANTAYYYKVLNLSTGVESDVSSFTTSGRSYEGAVVTSGAKAGDVIMYEPFDNFVWSGDLTTFSAGYSFSDEDFQKMTKVSDGTLTGREPSSLTVTAIDVQGKENYGLFNPSQAGAVIEDLGFSGWAYSSANGTKDVQRAVAVQPGFLKIGRTEATKFSLFSPPVTAFDRKYKATLKISFKACKFASPEELDPDTELKIAAVTDGTLDGYYISGYTTAVSKNVALSSTTVEWKEYSTTLAGVPYGARIAFSHNTSKRFFADDIKVEVVSLGPADGISGTILDEKSQPIEGVVVTDGYSVVKTDADGTYSMPRNSLAKFVYITVPSDCEVPYASDGYPLFYKTYSSSTDVYDFSLTKLPGGKQTKWNMLISTDNHYTSGYDSALKEEMKTMKDKLVAAPYENLYAFNCGDLVTNSGSDVWDKAKKVYAYANSGVHFFTLIGNHDHWSSWSDSTPSEARYMNRFGPTRYSVDRGDVHILMMDNIIAEQGKVCTYHGGFLQEEYEWLVNDLAMVDKNKTVILCTHCGFRTGNATSVHGTGYYHDETLQQLSKFKKAMLFSGHNHRSIHYNHTVGGKTIHETTFVSSLGIYGHCSWLNADGVPVSYTVLTFDGNDIVDKHFHTFGGSEYMLRMHDGNCGYSGTYLKDYGWGFEKGVIVANVFYIEYTDKVNWKVELYQGGKKCCDMSAVSSSMSKQFTYWNLPNCSNISSSGVSKNVYDWWQYNQYIEPSASKKTYSGASWPDMHNLDGFDTCSHLYYGKLTTVPSGEIMDQTDIEVRVTDPYGNVYSRTTFTKFISGASELYFRNID